MISKEREDKTLVEAINVLSFIPMHQLRCTFMYK